MCLAAKILGNLHFLIVFLGSPLNFDKEKWYYMYIEQFLKINVFLIINDFLPQFCDSDLEPSLNHSFLEGGIKTIIFCTIGARKV